MNNNRKNDKRLLKDILAEGDYSSWKDKVRKSSLSRMLESEKDQTPLLHSVLADEEYCSFKESLRKLCVEKVNYYPKARRSLPAALAFIGAAAVLLLISLLNPKLPISEKPVVNKDRSSSFVVYTAKLSDKRHTVTQKRLHIVNNHRNSKQYLATKGKRLDVISNGFTPDPYIAKKTNRLSIVRTSERDSFLAKEQNRLITIKHKPFFNASDKYPPDLVVADKVFKGVVKTSSEKELIDVISDQELLAMFSHRSCALISTGLSSKKFILFDKAHLFTEP